MSDLANTQPDANAGALESSFSLDLSVSLSSNREESFTARLSGEQCPMVGSRDISVQLLQKLLDQVTLHDSPPANETKEDQQYTAKQSIEWSRQCHIQPLSETDGEGRLGTFTNSTFVHQGHVAFVNLCRHALDCLGQETHHLISDGQDENLNEGNSSISVSEMKSDSSRLWPRKRRKKTYSRNSNQVPLQLFGSEYARFLSTTPLAPSDGTIPRPNLQPRSTVFRRRTLRSVQNIEEADNAVITGPITDIIVTQGDEAPPKGYYKLSQSASGAPFWLRDRKKTLHVCVKKEANWDRAAQRPCVTALTLIFPQCNEFVPPGFSAVRLYRSQGGVASTEGPPANLNVGSDSIAYLCFRRSREGNPITGIIPLFPSRRETIPEGYTVLERTPRNFVACFMPSNPIFFAYRQRLANLELLRPPPLLMSVYNGGLTVKRLAAYYCTSGTVVESRIGRFHIFDRSTHSLLSPSSISNRLSHIEASRRNTVNAIRATHDRGGEKYSYSGPFSAKSTPSTEILSSALLLGHGLGTPCSQSAMSESDRQSDFDSIASSSEANRSLNQSFGTSNVDAEGNVGTNRSFFVCSNDELKRCEEAMDFIPAISSGVGANDPDGAAMFQIRVTVLTPVLTACYARHGGSALIAVEGLTHLLRKDIFADDVNMTQISPIQTTLLDIAVQVVCDVATMSTQETQLYACVEFVQESVKYGCGYLSRRTIGYVLRFYLFVFCFGMSAPTGNWGVSKASDNYILEDPRTLEDSFLPGGAPQSAILSLKDLFVFLVARLGSLVYLDQCAVKRKKETARRNLLGHMQIFRMVDEVVTEVVDASVHRVGIANLTQLALHQIMRSGGSELFWHEMISSCGAELFAKDSRIREETKHLYVLCFALLANCVKIASSTVRKYSNSDRFQRDTASKLMSLELVKFFLETWERGAARQQVQGSHSLETFAFCVRRLVVPCLIFNTSVTLDDPRVFRRVIQIVGTLWCSPLYCKYMKLEIGVLFDHFILRILRLGPQILFKSQDDQDMTYLFAQQLEVMKELKSWFSRSDGAEGLLELFLNFDMEYSGSHAVWGEELLVHLQWSVCQRLCSVICGLSEKSTNFLGEKIIESQSTAPFDNLTKRVHESNKGYEGVSTVTLARESARRLRQGALDTITQITQKLCYSAAAVLGDQFQGIVDAWKNKEPLDLRRLHLQHFEGISCKSDDDTVLEIEARDDQVTSRTESSSVLGYWQRLAAVKQKLADSRDQKDSTAAASIELENDSAERKQTLNVAFCIATEKGLRKAIDFLIACNVLSAYPRDIASFLRIHRDELSAAALGKYLGEGGIDRTEMEYWNLIRFSYIRAMSFVGMKVEDGLRHLLTQGGFRLPGESQQIDRIISTFARCYWEDNAGDSTHCPFVHQDTIYLLSFAIIMLNTDLHKSTEAARRNQKKMTKSEFIDNLRGVGSGEEIVPEYLSEVYDKIASDPIILIDGNVSDDDQSVSSENIQSSIADLVNNAKNVDALLRGLSTHTYRFYSLEDYTSEFNVSAAEVTKEIIRKFVNKTWHEFHGLINSALEIGHLDPKALVSCVDLLKYSLSLTIMLDMPVQQFAFLEQLGRYRLFNSHRIGKAKESSSIDHEAYKKEGWFKKMERHARCPSRNGKLESLVILDKTVTRYNFFDDSHASRKAVRDAVKQLANAEFLLNDPNRLFVRSGNLMKRSNRSGRCTEYYFFLFSDVLLYAKQIPGTSRYRIHEELPLIMMKVVDWFPPELKKESKAGIQIYHPRKKFLVFCSSTEERKSWVTDIRGSIEKEIERKVAIEGARKAVASANVPSH